jgi:hypothetical protein
MAWLIPLILLTVANIAVSIAVARSHVYSHGQVVAQLCIVWLVPIAGALVVGLFLRTQRVPEKSRWGQGADPANWQNAENPPHLQGD